MMFIRSICLIIAVTLLSGCLSSGGGSAKRSADGGAFEGLALAEDGTAYWAVALVTSDQQLKGNLRDADDRLVGYFVVDLDKDEGKWYPASGGAETVDLQTVSRGESVWTAKLISAAPQSSWSLSLKSMPGQDSVPQGDFRLLVDGSLWTLRLTGSGQFELASDDCNLLGSWQSASGSVPAFLRLTLDADAPACGTAPQWTKALVYRDAQIPGREVLELIWDGAVATAGTFAFGGE